MTISPTISLNQRILDVANVVSVCRTETIDTEAERDGTLTSYLATVLTCDGQELMLTDDPISLVELVRHGVSADFLSMAPTRVDVDTDMTFVTVMTIWEFSPPSL